MVAEVTDYTSNGHVIFARKESLATLFPDGKLPRAEVAVVELADGASEDDVTRALLAATPGARIETKSALIARAAERVEESLGALDALGVLAGLIGFLAIASTLARSTLERRAQLAALRAIGATPRQVAQLVVVEAVALSALGAVPGVGLAVLFAFVFSRAASTMGLPLPTIIPWPAIAVAVLSALLAGVLASWGPLRRALATSPAEALGER